MQHHAAHRDHHAGTQLQQPFAERPDLSASTVGVCGAQAQLLHQHLGRSGQQHAELIGPEVTATGAVDLKSVQFFDPVLDLATLAVDLFVEPLRTLCHVGDDEARVLFRLFAFGANHLSFEDHAAFSRPRFCCVGGFAVDMFGLLRNT
jgi:hypothetical protein